MSGKKEGIVIPFHAARSGLWTAQREWMQTSGPVQQLAAEIGEVLGRAEQDLEEIEAALRDPHPAPARLGSFVRGELSPVENRALVRHLLIGCSDCSAVLRPLFRCHERAVS